jgi:glycosyltransferase involved in cell wall biosynthesis
MTSAGENPYSVSVVIPAYNSGKYIGRCIDSVLAQTLEAEELIVVDDGSTDNTARIVADYGSRIIFIQQENSGASAARNTGVQRATSEWIAFLDADDEWLSEKLSMQVEHLRRNPELVWAGTNYIHCLCEEERRGAVVEPEQGDKLLSGKEYFDDFFNAFLLHCGCWTGALIIKKDAIIQAGFFRPGQLMANDLDMWFRIAYRWPRFGYISKPLAIYHLNIPKSISQKYDRLEILIELYKRHLELAAEYDHSESFKPCVRHMVSSWVRGMLFENRPEEIRKLLKEFGYLLSFQFRAVVGLLIIFPKVTAGVCHTISKIVRALNLRKAIVRRPRRS